MFVRNGFDLFLAICTRCFFFLRVDNFCPCKMKKPAFFICTGLIFQWIPTGIRMEEVTVVIASFLIVFLFPKLPEFPAHLWMLETTIFIFVTSSMFIEFTNWFNIGFVFFVHKPTLFFAVLTASLVEKSTGLFLLFQPWLIF